MNSSGYSRQPGEKQVENFARTLRESVERRRISESCDLGNKNSGRDVRPAGWLKTVSH